MQTNDPDMAVVLSDQQPDQPHPSTDNLLAAMDYFSKLYADENNYRLREELRQMGVLVSLPKDEDE